MNTQSLIAQHKINLDWVNIGLWLTIKGNLPFNDKSILVKYKSLKDGEDILEVGVKLITGGK